jgi:hypothetical protein
MIFTMQSLRHAFRGTPLCSTIRSVAGGEMAVLNRFFATKDSATSGYGSPTWGSVSGGTLLRHGYDLPRNTVLMSSFDTCNTRVSCIPAA